MTDQKPEQELEIELSDEDILDAMQHFQGYIDIFADDFRVIYHHAYRHAIQRLTASFRAADLMRRDIPRLPLDMRLDAAAQAIVQSGFKGLPVTAEAGFVLGMLTETDFLRHLGAQSLIELLPDMALAQHTDGAWQAAAVRTAMTLPAVCVNANAGFGPVFTAFRTHAGRSMPVVDDAGKLLGLLLRADFVTHSLATLHLEPLL